MEGSQTLREPKQGSHPLLRIHRLQGRPLCSGTGPHEVWQQELRGFPKLNQLQP